MLSLTKMRKKLLSKKQYKIIKGFNSQGNFVSFKSEVDSSTFLEGKNAVGESSIKKTKVGLCTFIGSGCEMNNCKIGRFCSISSSVRVVANTHPLDFVSTYSGFYKSVMPRYPFGNVDFVEFLKTDGGFSCVIGNDVWIGRDVLIRGGVVIGDGAVIGMGAVVTKDVPPYSIVVGVPSKVIKKRFDDEMIGRLESIKWWDWPLEQIENRKDAFQNIESFLRLLGEVTQDK